MQFLHKKQVLDQVSIVFHMFTRAYTNHRNCQTQGLTASFVCADQALFMTEAFRQPDTSNNVFGNGAACAQKLRFTRNSEKKTNAQI